MDALLDDAAIVQNQNAVGVEHRREAMGDDQRGALRHHFFERGLHQHLIFRIERRGRLVEQQHGRIL